MDEYKVQVDQFDRLDHQSMAPSRKARASTESIALKTSSLDMVFLDDEVYENDSMARLSMNNSRAFVTMKTAS